MPEESEQFPEPLSPQEAKARTENILAPNPTDLTGKGYLAFHEPLEDAERESHLRSLQRMCGEAVTYATMFEGTIEELTRNKDSIARTCLKSTKNVIDKLEYCTRHPNDIEQIIGDYTFFAQLSLLVRELRGSGVLHFFDDFKSSDQDTYMRLAQEIEKSLVKIDVYFANRLEKDSKPYGPQ